MSFQWKPLRGDFCGEAVDRRSDENVWFGVGRGHGVLVSTAWLEMLGMKLWTKDSMGILVVV